MECRICGDNVGREYSAREMMFGLRDPFTYFECSGCGCLQLVDVPADMSRYYPENYYSFNCTQSTRRIGALRRWFARQRTRGQIFGGRGIGPFLARLRPRPDFSFFAHRPLSCPDAAVLDVGCGGGELLRSLAQAGCRALTGIDPFLPGDSRPVPGLRLLARSIDELSDGAYELVMFHHSFEHLPDQLGTLRAVSRLLRPEGWCLICVPVATSLARQMYGADWVDLRRAPSPLHP